MHRMYNKSSGLFKSEGKKLTGGGLPTLDDLKKTVPPRGLLNPGLRKGGGLGISKKLKLR